MQSSDKCYGKKKINWDERIESNQMVVRKVSLNLERSKEGALGMYLEEHSKKREQEVQSP